MDSTDFVLQTPSLQRVAAVKTAAHLWNQPDVCVRIAGALNMLRDGCHHRAEWNPQWREIEETVQSQASALPLPEPCREELRDIIKPMGVQLFNSCRYHNIHSWFPHHLRWTMHGTVDYAQTAASMVRDERFSLEERFEIACLNCLEDSVLGLGLQVQNDRRLQALTLERLHFVDGCHLLLYFASTIYGGAVEVERFSPILRRVLRPGESLDQYCFRVVLSVGTRAACEYFFSKLNPAQVAQVLDWPGDFVPLLRRPHSPTCGLLYYLSLLNEEQRRRMLRESPNLLPLLLEWPTQSMFEETVKLGWSMQFLPDRGEHAVDRIFNLILYRIGVGFRDFPYSRLFGELWRLSSVEQRRRFLGHIEYLERLFATRREEFIVLCLNHAPSRGLRELVENSYVRIRPFLMKPSVISDAALLACKEKAAAKSAADPADEEMRARSQHVGRLVDLVMETRVRNAENCKYRFCIVLNKYTECSLDDVCFET